ncbi:Aminoacyl tRNA synthase complex-interacting multifunctional protein 2 [Habropoda laboriosa]|uniref:Aminoacyl tRNA synthase complex-interacting multifunctional protein 2 n=1 Tax=Habropoda laboriosa TaxID=597456 RepID=A0A0L7QYW6_9HYME|nr:Aminoacyl tRNA synthase complex-interacting multifunctional protein 2 [Habropoda laboriosa]
MRNEMTMYTLKPIVSLPQTLYHRKTMYEMRNIHEERSTDDHTEAENKIVPDITEQVISFLKSPLPEYNALEIRQEKILEQLAELKKQVLTLSDFLKQTNQVLLVDEKPKCQETIDVNLIINVNPKRPPYFISALQKIWTDTDIKVQTYVHSSVSQEGPISYQSTTTSSRKNIINLSVIWKDVEDLELVSGLHNYHIIGETNFLSIHFEKSSKKQQEILLLIASKVDTNWSDKKTPDVADIVAWCTIKQIFPKKYPSKLNKWFAACEKLLT